MNAVSSYDIIVVGSGPAGQKAAIQGAKAGKRVALIEQEQGIGGNCVYRGTIPSKTLRESALQLHRLRRAGEAFQGGLRADVPVASLMNRLDEVVRAHESFMTAQLTRNRVVYLHGRARFYSDHQIELQSVDGARQLLTASVIVLATGTRPRATPETPIDHEHILDSDSILSMIYLPRSLTVIGSGVIGCEYASIFSMLGVQVTMIDQAARPLEFLDQEVVQTFQRSFEAQGGTYHGGRTVLDARWDGASHVSARLDNGVTITSEKMLVAVGRQANIEDLAVEEAGLVINEHGTLSVNEYGQTIVPHIYAAGDMLGPPALASRAMEQGRRAVCHALGLPVAEAVNQIPLGIYTLPEISSIGLDEEAACLRYRGPLIGRARFDEIARGQISGAADGLLKMVADPNGERLLGLQIVAEDAAELIHLGQAALQAGATIDFFVESIFNFPTYAEAYRVAALDILGQRQKRHQAAA